MLISGGVSTTHTATDDKNLKTDVKIILKESKTILKFLILICSTL